MNNHSVRYLTLNRNGKQQKTEIQAENTAEAKLKLKKQGLTALDKTRDYIGERYLSRGEGILDYLMNSNVGNYVILDDFQFDYDSCGLTGNYVKTDNYNGGLTEELAEKAIGILNR